MLVSLFLSWLAVVEPKSTAAAKVEQSDFMGMICMFMKETFITYMYFKKLI